MPAMILVALAVLAASFDASAACQCACVNGVPQAICSNPVELRPLCPPTLCPNPAPSLRPLPVPQLPPVGARSCAPEQVLNPYTGLYEWHTLCR